jgi:hypothetical protein
VIPHLKDAVFIRKHQQRRDLGFCIRRNFVKFGVLWTVKKSMLVFWVVTPSISISVSIFGVDVSEGVGSMFLQNVGIYLQVHTEPHIASIFRYFSPKDEGSMFLQNVSIYLQVHTAIQATRPTST